MNPLYSLVLALSISLSNPSAFAASKKNEKLNPDKKSWKPICASSRSASTIKIPKCSLEIKEKILAAKDKVLPPNASAIYTTVIPSSDSEKALQKILDSMKENF